MGSYELFFRWQTPLKIALQPLQIRIIAMLTVLRESPLDDLVTTLMVCTSAPGQTQEQLESSIRLQIDLLNLFGIIRFENRLGVQLCFVSDHLQQWAARNLSQKTTKMKKPSRTAPLVTATAFAVSLAGCSTLLSDATESRHVDFNQASFQHPPRLEQVYNPHSGEMVYRYCTGAECPLPTPKKHTTRTPVVYEVAPDGTKTVVSQNVSYFQNQGTSPNARGRTAKAEKSASRSTSKIVSRDELARTMSESIHEPSLGMQTSERIKARIEAGKTAYANHSQTTTTQAVQATDQPDIPKLTPNDVPEWAYKRQLDQPHTPEITPKHEPLPSTVSERIAGFSPLPSTTVPNQIAAVSAERSSTIQPPSPAPASIQEPVEVREIIDTELSIIFARNSVQFSESASSSLDSVVESLNKEARIEIFAWADDNESPNMSHSIAIQRAAQVKKYFESRGVPSNRITVNANMADYRRANPDDDERTYRRTEIKVFTPFTLLASVVRKPN
jgi:outer membrane protein OmpA-like peptidoglycan-associated protein